jgi:hypothetical protein
MHGTLQKGMRIAMSKTIQVFWFLTVFSAVLLKAFVLPGTIRHSFIVPILGIFLLWRILKGKTSINLENSYSKCIILFALLVFFMSLITVFTGNPIDFPECRLGFKWVILLSVVPVLGFCDRVGKSSNLYFTITVLMMIYIAFVPSAYNEDIEYTYEVLSRSAELNRYTGIFFNPIYLASYIFVMFTFLLSLYENVNLKFKNALYLSVLGFVFYIYFITMNKQNILFFLVNIYQISILILYRNKTNINIKLFDPRVFKYILASIFLIIILVAYLFFFDSEILLSKVDFWNQRLSTIYTQARRYSTMDNGLLLIYENPFWGVGYGMVPSTLRGLNLRGSSVHNTVLHLMASGGIFFGFSLYFILFFRLPFVLFSKFKKNYGNGIFLIGFICIFIQSLFESLMHKEHFFLYFGLWAFYVFVINGKQNIVNSKYLIATKIRYLDCDNPVGSRLSRL